MDTEITVSGIHQSFEIGERQRLVGCECTDDPETQTLVNQTIEIRSGALLLRTRRTRIRCRRNLFTFSVLLLTA